MSYDNILVKQEGAVGIIQINRPKALNALNIPLIGELVAELKRMDRDDSVRVVILTGNERAFAAGADIKEMVEASAVEMQLRNQFTVWDDIAAFSKPLIAAVSGFALGGGCELMMHCDMVIASETAQFGQPEINLGIMPGAGGTQRLTKTIGKLKAMEMCLTGDMISAQEALQYRLVNRVVPTEGYMEEALKIAHRIAEKAPIATRLIKEAVNKAVDNTLKDGLDFERKSFNLLFASEDQKEGMRAFIEKRKPNFQGK
jgi:enoyl-CoA hydratase